MDQGLQSQGSLMQSTLHRTVSMAYFEKSRRMQGGVTPVQCDMRPIHPAALAFRFSGGTLNHQAAAAGCWQHAKQSAVLDEWVIGTCLHKTVCQH